MFKIISRKELNAQVTMLEIEAPLVAKKAKAGQFIILRVDEEGERIPLTVAGRDENAGSVRIIFQVVGATTARLNQKKVGDFIADFAGPLGKPTELDGLKKVLIVGGGVGSAIALPIAEALRKKGAFVHSIVGFRSRELVILEEEFKASSQRLEILTDDGSYGEKGLVTEALKRALLAEQYDEIFAIGPLIMMKFVVETAKPFGTKTTVSMNPIMIDGTGMCGGCRLTVGGETKFACVDGPDFDGYEVDFDEAMRRSRAYGEFERHRYESNCNLFGGDSENAEK